MHDSRVSASCDILPGAGDGEQRRAGGGLTERRVLQRRTIEAVTECAEVEWPGRTDPSVADLVVFALRVRVWSPRPSAFATRANQSPLLTSSAVSG